MKRMPNATTAKWYLLGFCLAVFSGRICAQQADPCSGLAGAALNRCEIDQQKLQQQQLTQQQQQLTQLQQQLAQQQRQLAQQQEQLQRQQDQLAQQQVQIARQQAQPATRPATPAATEQSRRAELRSWKAGNRWYGSDYARTQFAMRYARQLQQERPDLVGRPFLDAISARVRDTFGADK
jgi:TolA-binding protein